jgi:hypothetical protein
MIPNPNPIVADAIPSKTYDKLHVYSLSAIQPTANPNTGSITVQLLPATADGDLAPGDQVQRLTAPLNEEILSAVPELAAAFAAVLAAIAPTRNYLEGATNA